MSTTFSNALFSNISTTTTVSTVATATLSVGNIVTVSSTAGMYVNMPIVFSGNGLSGSNIVAGTTYFIASIVNTAQITISATSGGSAFVLTTQSGSSLNVVAGGPTPIVASASNARVTVVGLSIANTSSQLAFVTIQIVDGNNNNNTANYAYQIPIPANQTAKLINGGERLVLGPNMTVTASANVTNTLDIVASYVIIQ